MKDFQKMGGIAALIEAAAYVVGIVFSFTLLAPYTSGELDPAGSMAFVAGNLGLMQAWYLIIYVVFGVFLAVLALALHERLKLAAPATMQVATAFALVWVGLVIASGFVFNVGAADAAALYGSDPAGAASMLAAIGAVQDGLGGGVELVGGLWVLLLSWAALRRGGLPAALNYLGVVVGVAGILTVIPPLGELGGMVFGLGQIVWFVWLGVVLLRARSAPAAVAAPAK